MLNYLADDPSRCWADQDYLENNTWLSNFPLLKKYGLDFDPMCFSNHLPGIAKLADKNSEIQFILEHTGMPYDHTPEGRKVWSDGMRVLAERENASVKISGFGTTVDNWNEALIRPYVLTTIDLFGADRVCFASNFPTDKVFSSMSKIWDAFLSITADFSEDEKDKMFAMNAKRLYRI